MTATEPAADPRMHTGLSLSLIMIGTLLFLSGPVIGLLVASSAGLSSALGELGSQARFSVTTTVDAPDGGTFFLYTAQTTLPSEAICAVALADSEPVPVAAAPREQNTNAGWTRFESFARFDLPTDSKATVTCAEQPGDVVVGPKFDDAAFLGDIFGWTLTGGGLIMAVGFASAIVGIVKYPRRAPAQPRESAAP